MNKKVIGLIKYRIYNTSVEIMYVIVFILAVSIIGAVLGFPVIASMLMLYSLPSMVSFNGLEKEDLKATKTQLAMPISRKENILTRFSVTLLFQAIGVVLAFALYSTTPFFINLGWGEALTRFDLGSLQFLISNINFIPIFLFTVGLSLLDRGLYFMLSYTIFKKVGKPPWWTGIIIFGFAGFIGGGFENAIVRNLLGNHMQLFMFLFGAAIYILSYFVSVRAFRKIDFS